MRILIAEDDAVSRLILEAVVRKWGHEVIVTTDGAAAWEVLRQEDAPPLAVLDWMMPGMDGIEVCRRVRQCPPSAERPAPYLILLTARGTKEDVVTGLESGADDYVVKPFDRDELRARLNVGLRMAALQQQMAGRVRELDQALQKVKQLQEILPICSYCKRVRDDQNYWQQVEAYLAAHSDVRFSHSICPPCYESVVRPQLDDYQRSQCPV